MSSTRRRGLVLCIAVLCLPAAVPGCTEHAGKKIDVMLVEDDTLLTPDTPIILPLNAQNQVKLYDHWYDIYTETAQVDEFLSRKARRYKAMYAEFGIERERRRVGGECILVFPVDVIIEPQPRTKVGAISRLNRMCREHGFYKVSVQREWEDEATRL
jgi:hypothetical protein